MSGVSNAVFLSYASEDTQAAERIATVLRGAGIEVWFDKSELRGGDAWDRQIREQIHDCRLFIPVISANSERRDEGYFRREWRLAVERAGDMAHKKAFIVPVVIDGTAERGASVPEKFHELQWTRLPNGETTPSFVERTRTLLSPEASSARPAVTAAAPSSIPEQTPRPSARSSRLTTGYWVAGTVLAAALAYFAVGKLWYAKGIAQHERAAASTAAVTDKSIAVLPFVDLSEKHDQEYFADGLAEEVLSLLATLPGLKVISRTSSFQFKGRNADLRAVGEQLGAAHLVEGSVRRYGDRVRVTAQLIRASDGTHRWSDNYERNVGDLLVMQQEIAAAIARALQVEVGSIPRQAATLPSTEAYTLYLHGLHSMDRFDQTGFEEAIGYFERALAIDPTLFRAREKLAQVHYLQIDLGFVTAAAGGDLLRRNLDRVLREDEHSSMGHALRAELLITYDWDWAAAQREADLAVSLGKNNSLALYAAADLAGVLGRWDESGTLFRQALALDPLDADTYEMFSWMLFHAGRFAEAETEGRRGLEIRSSYATAHLYLGLILLAQGRLQDALSVIQLEGVEGPRRIGLAMVFHALHRKADSDAAMQAAERVAADRWAYEIACAHAYRGEADAAFQWLERGYKQRDFLMEYIKGEWALKSLEGDPHYKALLHKMNLPE